MAMTTHNLHYADNVYYRKGDTVSGTAFSRKLDRLTALNATEIAMLDDTSAPTRTIPPHRDLIAEGDKPGPTFLLLNGWACRYKVLTDGSRQIVAFLMPGDFGDIDTGSIHRMDHSIGTLTECQVVSVPSERMRQLTGATATLARAFGRSQMIDEGVMRAWIVNIGRRDSVARVGHLLLELYARLGDVGLTSGGSCRLPLTQTVLADALGLTPVHLNRVLRDLRERDVATLSLGTLHIEDLDELVRIAGFDGSYLHRRAIGSA